MMVILSLSRGENVDFAPSTGISIKIQCGKSSVSSLSRLKINIKISLSRGQFWEF